MAKTCPKRFDVECEHIFDCKVPRLALRCRYLEVEVESTHVFMGNPIKNCTVICRRTGRPFNSAGGGHRERLRLCSSIGGARDPPEVARPHTARLLPRLHAVFPSSGGTTDAPRTEPATSASQTQRRAYVHALLIDGYDL